MGLCLYVLDRDLGDEEDEPEELGMCDVGHYSDFEYFRETIKKHLGSDRYPVLTTHSDCDGEWPVDQIPALKRELAEIGEKFQALPPEQLKGAFEHNAELAKEAESLYECFYDVDEENLFESILSLCDIALTHERPIVFM